MTRKPSAAPVLVASDNAADAEQVVGQLSSVMENVRSATNPESAVADFETCKPEVLVLGFRSIELAQRYSLGLYRHSQMIKLHRHATVLLCAKDDVCQAFTLCREGYFDDYALHWPMAQDGYRLPMSVWKAADQLIAQSNGPSPHDLSAHATELDALEQALETTLAESGELAQLTAGSLKRAEHAVGSAIDEFSRRLDTPVTADAGRVKEKAQLAAEIVRLKSGGISQAFQASQDELAAVSAWPRRLQARIEPHAAGLRSFARQVREARWLVMVIDDDEFARKLIAKSLSEQGYELTFAADGTTALAMLRRVRPHLILMDVNLPDLDGVSLTRKLKSTKHLAPIPIVMLTGDARRETLENSMSAGAAGFIVKPFTREAIVAKLDRLLRH
jgi:CheY-like chemotaxis protein